MGKGPCPLAGVAENLWPLLVVCTGKGPSSGRGLVGVAGVTLWLRLLHLIKGEEGAAFNNVMLP